MNTNDQQRRSDLQLRLGVAATGLAVVACFAASLMLGSGNSTLSGWGPAPIQAERG